MTTAEAIRIKQKALICARQLGFAEEAECIANEVLVKYLSHIGSKQLIKHAVMDVIRHRFGGNPRRPELRGKQWSAGHKHQELLDDQFSMVHEPYEPDMLDQFQRLKTAEISGRTLEVLERAVVILATKWGMTFKEIAHVFGTHPTWVNTTMKATKEKLLAEARTNERKR